MSSRRGKGVSFIASGVRNDCHTLLEKFKAKKSMSFDSFVEVWKEMYFPYIFLGRKTFAELWELTEEILLTAKSFMLAPHPNLTRIGAIYLTYSLYMRQPTQKMVKIRITLEEFSEVLDFIHDVVIPQKLMEAYYVFCKMMYEEAFQYVAKSREYGLERKYRKYFTKEATEPLSQKQSDLEQVFDDKMLDHLGALEMKYYTMKCCLEGPNAKGPPRVLNYAKKTTAVDLKKLISSITSSDRDDTIDFDTGERLIGNVRKSIKDRAFTHVAAYSRSKGVCSGNESITDEEQRKERGSPKKQRSSSAGGYFDSDLEDSEDDEDARNTLEIPDMPDLEIAASAEEEADQIGADEFEKRLNELKNQLFNKKFDEPSKKDEIKKGKKKSSNVNSKKKKKDLCEVQIKVEEVADVKAGEPSDENVVASTSKVARPPKKKKVTVPIETGESTGDEESLVEPAVEEENQTKVVPKAKGATKKKIVSDDEPKKKRGRPRKNPPNISEPIKTETLESTNTEGSVEPCGTSIKKEPKTETESNPDQTSEGTVQVRRKRGRPRKIRDSDQGVATATTTVTSPDVAAVQDESIDVR